MFTGPRPTLGGGGGGQRALSGSHAATYQVGDQAEESAEEEILDIDLALLPYLDVKTDKVPLELRAQILEVRKGIEARKQLRPYRDLMPYKGPHQEGRTRNRNSAAQSVSFVVYMCLSGPLRLAGRRLGARAKRKFNLNPPVGCQDHIARSALKHRVLCPDTLRWIPAKILVLALEGFGVLTGLGRHTRCRASGVTGSGVQRTESTNARSQ